MATMAYPDDLVGTSASIIAGQRANEHDGVGGDLHRLPTQPRLAIAFISSIDSVGPPSRLRTSKPSATFPCGRAARTSIRPSASL
jgi:hypothetical protein